MEPLVPLGDQGVLARSATKTRLCAGEAVRALDAPWLLDVVQAYTTVAVFHDLDRVGLSEVLANSRR